MAHILGPLFRPLKCPLLQLCDSPGFSVQVTGVSLTPDSSELLDAGANVTYEAGVLHQ